MSKELLNFMTWVNQDEKLGYTSIGIERIVNRYITSKDLIIRDAYENYVKTHRVGFLGIKNTIMSQNEFINKCKTDQDFSENWGLKIEERELNVDELNIVNLLKQTSTKLITITYNDKTIESYE